MDLVAKPTLRPDHHNIADKKHSNHQLWINRWPPRGTAEGRKMLTKAREINEPVDRTQHAVWRNMSFD